MKISIVSNYLPKRCGIATFTNSLYRSIQQVNEKGNLNLELDIVAFDEIEREFPPEVKHSFNQHNYLDYIKASKILNTNGTDVCIIQHEFGIYGGEDGAFIMPLIHRLEIPIILTMHTVLVEPSYTQKFILKEIANRVDRIIVMSHKAVGILKNKYDIPKEKLMVVAHGIPFIKKSKTKEEYRKALGLTHKNILLTFGLLSRNKGIELVVKALPKIVEKHPDTQYLIVGRTHPKVIEYNGEEYREYLIQLAKELNVFENIKFVDHFLQEQELLEYLHSADIFLTPYRNEIQITSGALCYAMGSGCVIVSSKYWHASELLADNNGVLIDMHDEDSWGPKVVELLDDPSLMKKLSENGLKFGSEVSWDKIGLRYFEFTNDLIEKKDDKKIEIEDNILNLEKPDLTHIKRLTDDTAMIQHGKFSIPNLGTDYCADDNARALFLMTMQYRFIPSKKTLELSYIYLRFLYYLQLLDGNFRNFLSYNRNFMDEGGTEDSFGRTIWAIGYLVKFAPNDSMREIALKMMVNSMPHFKKLKTIRGIANTMIGIAYYLEHKTQDEEMRKVLKEMADKLMVFYDKNKTLPVPKDYVGESKNWEWFENILTYDNSIMPLALLQSYEQIHDKKYLEIALKTNQFLEGATFSDNIYSPIGCQGWYPQDGEKAIFDQQPIEAMVTTLFYRKLYQITNDHQHLDKMVTVFKWYWGENLLRLPMLDQQTGGCCDGLESDGINRNQGAESTLSYWIAHTCTYLSLEDYLNKDTNHRSKINII